MSYSKEKVNEMITAVEFCYNALASHIIDLTDKKPKTSSTIRLLLNHALREVAQVVNTLDVVLIEIDIEG